MTRTGWAVVGMLALAAPLAAQSTAPTVVGSVQDEHGAAVVDAQVLALSAQRTAVTDEAGRFVLRGVRPGRQRVAVSAVGYAPVSREVEVPQAGEVPVNIVLRRTVLALPGIQVTATPTGGDVRAATQGTTQLNGRALEREMAGTVAQTLRFQPGLAVRSMGPAASAPIIRGLTGDRILVLQDGQRTADLSGSADDHGVTIDPLIAQRVEVVRGPATLLYGNNALGGVVNVISGDVPTHAPRRAEHTVSMQSESAYPGLSVAGRVTAPVGGRWAVSARAGGRRTDDMHIPSGGGLGPRLANTHARNWSGALGGGYQGDRLVGGGSVKAFDFAYGLPVPPGSDPVSLRGRRLEAVGRLESALSSPLLHTARLEATVQDYLHDELDGSDVVQQTFALGTRSINALVRQGALGPFSEGAWGVSGLFKRYAATGPAALTPAADSRGLGVFGFQEVALGGQGAALQAGGRFDHYAIESRSGPKFGPGRARAFQAVSGSLGLRSPQLGGVSGGVHLSRSFRAPTVEELFSGAPHAGTGSVEFGDPTLRAERGWSQEAVLQLSTGRVNGQAAVFRNRISDYIHLRARGDTLVDGVTLPVFTYAQSDATLQGVEAQVEWAMRGHLVVGAMADLIHAEQRDGTPLSFMPPPRLGGSVRWDDGVVSVGGDAHHEFRQDRVGAADERPTPAHTVLRAFAGLRFRRGGTVHSVTLRGENLSNELHREATSRTKDFAPGPGRNLALMYRVYF